MVWRRTRAQCEAIYETIAQNPGIRRTEIAQLTGLPRYQVSRLIPKMDQSGFLLMEDNKRGLYTYDVHGDGDSVTVPDFLVRGLGLPPLDVPPSSIDEVAYDAITGVGIAEGYRAMDIVPKAAGEFLDLLRGNVDGWVSEATARAFKGTWNLGNRLIFEDGTHFYPLIGRESARKRGRACWSDLVRNVWASRRGERLLVILTTDFRKRLWPRARIGTLGQATAAYIHDANLNVSSLAQIDWPGMLATLGLVERVYLAGFSKRGIINGLLSEFKAVQSVGMLSAVDWEKQLQAVRGGYEFTMAAIIAQKGD